MDADQRRRAVPLAMVVALLALAALPAAAVAVASPLTASHQRVVEMERTNAALGGNTLGTPANIVELAVRKAHPRNRLIGPHLDVGVSIYSDCTGRTALTTTTAAIDTCVKRDVYFVGHSFGGPFTSLTHAYNGESLTWYDSAGVAHRYIIRGHQYTYAYGPIDTPPRGTAAQFQTCLTRSGSRIIIFYATSR